MVMLFRPTLSLRFAPPEWPKRVRFPNGKIPSHVEKESFREPRGVANQLHLALRSPCLQAAAPVFAQNDEGGQQRQYADQRAQSDEVIYRPSAGVRARAVPHIKPKCQWIEALLIQNNQRQEEIVPSAHETEQSNRHQARLHQGHADAPENLPFTGT